MSLEQTLSSHCIVPRTRRRWLRRRALVEHRAPPVVRAPDLQPPHLGEGETTHGGEDAKGGDEIQVAAEGASMGVVAVSVPQGVMGGSVFHVELPVHAGADDCDPGLRRLANLVVNT